MAVFFMVPLFCRPLEMIRTKKNAHALFTHVHVYISEGRNS
jgi:hypothetical protein